MLCKTCEKFTTRPSAMLNIEDPYTAYCLDEAAAFLLMQNERPDYRKKMPINRNKKALESLKRYGAKIHI